MGMHGALELFSNGKKPKAGELVLIDFFIFFTDITTNRMVSKASN